MSSGLLPLERSLYAAGIYSDFAWVFEQGAIWLVEHRSDVCNRWELYTDETTAA